MNEQCFYREFHFEKKLWLRIYSFRVETTTIQFLMLSTKNRQKRVTRRVASPCKKYFQYKTIGGEILVSDIENYNYRYCKPLWAWL